MSAHTTEQLALDAVCHAARMAGATWQEVAYEHQRPSVLYRPSITLDGGVWCALYGANLQDGVAGFGSSPNKAMSDFDRNWLKEVA